MKYKLDDQQSGRDLNLILKTLSFLIPIIGFLIYGIKRDTHRKAAHSACEMAIGGILFFAFLKMLFYAYETRNGNFFK